MPTLHALLEEAHSYMDPDETPEAAILGAYVSDRLGRRPRRRGVMIATDRRVVFYARKLGGYELEVFPYPTITAVEGGRGALGAHVTIYAGGLRARMKRVRKGAINRFTDTVRAMIGRPEPGRPEPAPPAPPQGAADFAEQIEKLGALRDRGLLSEGEFEAKKAEILARI
jgi:hypothetical protein